MAERRWYVDDDRQGGSFGMSYGSLTAEQWLDVATDWLLHDDAFEPEYEDEDSPWYSVDNFIDYWEKKIAEDPQEFIDFFDDYWELTMVEGERPKDHWYQDDEYESLNRLGKLTLDEDFDEDIQEIGQEFTSANTSINSTKVPAVFKMVSFEPNTVNLDFGGGKYNTAADYLSDYDVINLVYDPYNRSEKHNKEVIATLKEHGGADTCTCSNVLNVIKEPEVRLNVLNNIKKLLKPDGTCYITVYEGTGKGDEGETKSGYQLNRKTADYVEEIKQVFPNVTRKGKLIVAKA